MGRSKSRLSKFGLGYDTMKHVTKFYLAINTLLGFAIVSGLLFSQICDSKVISKSVLCADTKCDELYGDGKTTNQYHKDSDEMLAFKKDANVKIFGKTEDGKHLLVQIDKKRGFVPNNFVKESKIYNPKLEHKVDIDFDKVINGQKLQSQIISNAEFVSSPTVSSATNQLDGSLSTSESSFASSASASIEQTSATETDHMLYASKSPIVIDGTTFDEDILRTPSPTYNPEIAVTKTATIEANFNEQSPAEAEQPAPVQQNVVDVDAAADKGKIFKMLNVNSSIHLPSAESNETLVKNEKGDATTAKLESQSNNQDGKESPELSNQSEPVKNVDSETNKPETYLNQTLDNDGNDEGDEDDSMTVESEEDNNNTSGETVSNTSKQTDESDKIEAAETSNTEPIVVAESVPVAASDNLPNPEILVPQTEVKSENLSTTSAQLNSTSNENKVGEQTSTELPTPVENVQNLSNIEQLEQGMKNLNLNDPSVLDSSPVVPNSEPIVASKTTINQLPEETKVNSLPETKVDSQPAQPEIIQAATNLNQGSIPEQQVSEKLDVPNSSVSEPGPVVLDSQSNTQPLPNSYLNVPSALPETVLPTSESSVPIINSSYQPEVNHSEIGSLPDVVVVAQQDTLSGYTETYMNPSVDYSPTPNSNPIPNLNPDQQHYGGNAANYHAHAQEIVNPTENLAWKSSASQNVVDTPEIVHTKPINQNEPQQQPPPPPTVDNNDYHLHHHHHSKVNSNQALPASSDSLQPEPDNYSSKSNENRSKRRLFAERVAFVSVINDIIPDEVELFFENFNLSLHAVVFTSIVAFSWCLMKVFLYFVSSSKTERELRESSTQSIRKIYYFEAEKDKLREEMNILKDKLSNQGRELHQAETRKNQFELENERIRNEIQLLKKENTSLRNQADQTPQIYSKLDNVSSDYEKCKEENRRLQGKVQQLESTIASNDELINKLERTAKSNNEEIETLNDKLQLLSEENEEFKSALKQSEENFDILQLENKELKESKSQLNEEMKNMKDELLSLQEKSKNFEDENVSLTEKLSITTEQLLVVGKELEEKTVEIVSMQALLNKLNKNISKEHYRRQMSTELNGDLVDELAGGDHQQTVDNNVNSNEIEFNGEKSEEDTDNNSDMQDIVKLQLRLTNLELEKQHLQEMYDKIESQVGQTKADIESTKQTNERLQEEIEIASKERMKAVMELEVLSKYYKEKELEYGKEIGVQHLKRQQKEEDADTLVSDLQVTKEENELLKKQIKSTKKELEDTERRYKSQLNQLEKQSHENWIAARNVERKYEESKAEATALRQTLTLSVKSPPPNELSISGYNLDDTASSISSLPDGLNTSLQLPPPPPPPPFPLMMANSMLPMPPPSSGPQSSFFDQNDPSVVPGWNPPPFAMQPPPVTSNSYQDFSKNAQSSYPNSLESQLSYERSNQISQSAYTQPYAQQLQQPPPPPPPQQPTNHNVQQIGSSAYGQYQSVPHHQWEDPNRNTYSPMSQRSTHTPLTNSMAPPLAHSSSTYSSVPLGSSASYDVQRQHQQYQPMQYDASGNQPNDRSSVGPAVTPAINTNPFSISGSYGQQQSSGYHHLGYNQQQQQQPVDNNVNYNSMSRPPATVTPSQTSHQIWTAAQSIPDISQSHNSNNNYSAYPTHANVNNVNPSTQNPNPYASNVPPPPLSSNSHVPESNSRPASVHTQMV